MFQYNSDSHFAKSPLNFEVVKTPLFATMPDGSTNQVKGKVGLTRTDSGETISIVGDRYGVVQNANLFNRIDEEVFSAVGEEHKKTARVRDNIAKQGALCVREYAFPNIKMDDELDTMFRRGKDDVTDLGFRLLVSNGFGGSSLAVESGAIDFYCSNGVILGKLHGSYQLRHTSNVEIRMVGVEKAAGDAVGIFRNHAPVFARYIRTPLTDSLAKLTIDESKAFSKSLCNKIFSQWVREKEVRGANAWALFSAATYYASHSGGMFAMRRTKNDHYTSTMMAREKKVNAFVASAAFQSVLRTQ